MNILGKLTGLFSRTPVQAKPNHSWYQRPRGNTRIADPSRSFLDNKEGWWVFDWDGRIAKEFGRKGNSGLQEDVFSDRKFVMYARDGKPMAFRQQVLPKAPMAPARLRGKVYLLNPNQIKELDEKYLNQVQSIRTRTRLVFPDWVAEFPKKTHYPIIPTMMHAWMWFDRTNPELLKDIQWDYDMFHQRECASFLPVKALKHYREHISYFFNPSHKPITVQKGYQLKENDIHATTPTLS
jgi:hypothetical protein